MLGLREQIRGDEIGARGRVGNHKHFAGSGKHVDIDLPEHRALGQHHEQISRPDDFFDRRDRLRAISQRADGLRAAEPVNFFDAQYLAGAQHPVAERAVFGARRHDHQFLHAGHLRRDGVHQHTRRIRRGAAGNIKPRAAQRRPGHSGFHRRRSARSFERNIGGHQAALIIGDALRGQLQRGAQFFRRPRGPGPALGC